MYLRVTSTLLIALMCGVSALAQYTTASFGGTAVDPSGAAIPNTKITVRNLDTGYNQTINTDDSGAFLFPRLPVGNYELRAEHAGFSTYQQTGIRLAVNQSASQTIAMQVGQVAEQVTVEASAELVTTRTGTVGQLIDEKRIVELPLNGRRAQTLVFLAAGTVDLGRNGCRICGHGGVYPGEQTAGVNGAGMGQVNYQLDGAGHNDTYLNTSAPFPNPDAVQEFNLESTNFTAEYGNAAGGIVNIVTRSGTNQVHGSLFEFLRNGKLNARNFFSPARDTLKRNQFGGSVGGPIKRDKLFYFGTYQGTKIRSEPAGRVVFVPTPAERTGNFSGLTRPLVDPVTQAPIPGNLIPASRISPVANYILKYVPDPNRAGREANFPTTASKEDEHQFMLKADYVLSKHQIGGRYFFTDYKQPPVIPDTNLLSAVGSANLVRVQNVSVNHTYTMRPNILLTSTFGLNRQRGGSRSSAPFSFPDAGVKIASAKQSALAAPPELVMSVTGAFSVSTNHLGDFDRGDVTIRENLTWIKGGHEFHFGGEAVRLTNHIINTFRMDGSFTFNGSLSGDGLADFMMGRASAFTQGGGEFKNLKGTRWGFFAQDNWRVSPRLTVNLGVRWDPYWPYYDREGRVVCYRPGQKSVKYPNALTGMLYGGDNADAGCPVGGSESNVWNISPRLGFAYKLTSDNKTSIRGGIGYFYTPIQASTFNPFTNIAPFAPGFTFNGVDFTDPYGSAGATNPFPAQYGPAVPGPEAVFFSPAELRAVFDPKFRTPLLTTWSLNLERQVYKDWVARIGYVANKGTYFFGAAENSREINAAIYQPGTSTVANTQARRPNPLFSTIGYYESGNNSNYQSLILNLEKRFAKGLSMLVNYTFSKKIDDYGWTNPSNRRFDYGLSREDVPHNFKLSNVWEIPRMNVGRAAGAVLNGWMVNSIVAWQSGFPFSVTTGADNSRTGVNRDRADFLGGQPSLGTSRSHGDMVARYFDTSLFVANALGTFGNSGKNILRAPNYFNADLGLTKNTRIKERVAVQFRAEFFNLFNNVVFNAPNSSVASAQIGRITSALDPRILQFGMKALF